MTTPLVIGGWPEKFPLTRGEPTPGKEQRLMLREEASVPVQDGRRSVEITEAEGTRKVSI
jgi:hypothetical protein